MDRLADKTLPPDEGLWSEFRPEGDKPWSLLTAIERSVMSKMLAKGTPLGHWDVKLNRGILTGYNEAFIVDNATRRSLVAQDPKSAEIMKPILRGRDIRRYRANLAERWLIYSHENIDIDTFPAIKAHLLPHKPALSKRTGGARRDKAGNLFVPYEWHELQVDYYNSGAYKEFAKEKLFWMDLTERGRFAYDEGEMYCVNTVYMLSGSQSSIFVLYSIQA